MPGKYSSTSLINLPVFASFLVEKKEAVKEFGDDGFVFFREFGDAVELVD